AVSSRGLLLFLFFLFALALLAKISLVVLLVGPCPEVERNSDEGCTNRQPPWAEHAIDEHAADQNCHHERSNCRLWMLVLVSRLCAHDRRDQHFRSISSQSRHDRDLIAIRPKPIATDNHGGVDEIVGRWW